MERGKRSFGIAALEAGQSAADEGFSSRRTVLPSMPDLEIGESIEMKGAGAKSYVIENAGVGSYRGRFAAGRRRARDPAARALVPRCSFNGETTGSHSV
jgi:hypothetical protein